MQLYVLGPAFGLPSIDPECLAAIALLQLYSPGGWTLVPTHDLAFRLPRLVDFELIVSGYKQIAEHITTQIIRDFGDTNVKQRADSTAISSFIQSKAQLLVDISLYVSYENYSSTRSAFTRILTWYANYITPPSRRKDARARTKHLGISSIDVDDVHEDLSNRPSTYNVGKEKPFEDEAKQRASLLLPNRNTVRGLLRRPEHSSVFKLQALADNCFQPLMEILGENVYLLGTDEPQAVDCLAYGYLALMLYPSLPQDWLAKTLRTKYPKLIRYVERMHERLELQTSVDEVMSLMKCKSTEDAEVFREKRKMTLPWEPPVQSSAADITKTVAFDFASRVPLIGPSRTQILPAHAQPSPFWQHRYFPAILATMATSFGMLGYYAFATGLLNWPRGDAVHIFGRKRFSDYGNLGAALAGISFLGQQASNHAVLHPQDISDNPVRVEVEVEKDGLP